MESTEAMCRAFLQNAAAKHWAASQAAPEAPTAEYLTGFGDGWEAGHVAALALVVSTISGESMTELIGEVDSQARVEATFPFDLVISGERAETPKAA